MIAAQSQLAGVIAAAPLVGQGWHQAGELGLALLFPAVSRRLPRSSTALSTLRVRYLDGHGVLRRLLAMATAQGFTIEEVSTEHLGDRRGRGSAPGGVDGQPIVEVMLSVHGRSSVNDLAAAMSDMEDVDAVLVGDANAIGD